MIKKILSALVAREIRELKKTNGKTIAWTILFIISTFISCWFCHMIYFIHWSSKSTQYHFNKNEFVNIFNQKIYPSQKNLDLALKYSGIKVPESCEYPKFVADKAPLFVYAEVTQNGIYKKRTVHFYPNAFSRWSTLLSTLSHELEIHCRQDFFSYYLISDVIGLSEEQREALIEIPAYQHEIKEADRFQNSNNLDGIKENIALFYIHLEGSHLYD